MELIWVIVLIGIFYWVFRYMFVGLIMHYGGIAILCVFGAFLFATSLYSESILGVVGIFITSITLCVAAGKNIDSKEYKETEIKKTVEEDKEYNEMGFIDFFNK